MNILVLSGWKMRVLVSLVVAVFTTGCHLIPGPTSWKAKSGDPEAMYQLGLEYFEGTKRDKNWGEALKWFHQAADKKHAPAQTAIGTMFYRGDGVPQDYAQALKWFTEASGQGYIQAIYSLGIMYSNGQGVPRDLEKAASYLEFAANSNHGLAQVEIAKLLGNMRIANPVNPEHSAEFWNRKLAEAGHPDGMIYFGNVAWENKKTGEACDWYKKAMEKNHPAAGFSLASCIRQKAMEGTAEDALALMQKSADGGYLPAIAELARMSYAGEGVPQDKKKALELYRLAAQNGDVYGAYNLAYIFRYDQEYANAPEARAIFEKLTNSFAPAQYELALMNSQGIGGPQDPQKTLQLIGAAAQNNFAPAQYTLGMMFLKGEGVDRDQGQAQTWLNKAAEAGHTEARTALAKLSGRTVEDAKNGRPSKSTKQAH